LNFSSQKISLAHVDHSYFFRQGIKYSLKPKSDYDLRISVSHIDKLLSKLKSAKIDILLLGDYDFLEYPIDDLLLKLVKTFPRLSVIAFQSPSSFDQINHLIKMGIKSFIPKNTSEKEFFLSIDNVKRDGFFFDTETTRDLIEKIQKEQKLTDLNLALSGIEKQILQLVCNGYTAEEISVKLKKSKKTIEGYRSRMLKKANVRNIAELVSWGFRNDVVI